MPPTNGQPVLYGFGGSRVYRFAADRLTGDGGCWPLPSTGLDLDAVAAGYITRKGWTDNERWIYGPDDAHAALIDRDLWDNVAARRSTPSSPSSAASSRSSPMQARLRSSPSN